MFEEKIFHNGVSKSCHNVVKNAPFTIQYECPNVDFSNALIHCQLLYDSSEFRPIPFLSKQPLEYYVHFGSEKHTFTVEFRIKVLSSQYEHSLFLVQLNATLQNGHVFTATSAPILCVSKPDQIKRKKEAALNAMEPFELDSAPKSRKRKRDEEEASNNNDENIINMLKSIQQTQVEQLKLLKQQTSVSSAETRRCPLSLEESFTNFFTAVHSYDEHTLAAKLKQLLATSSPDLLKAVSSFVRNVAKCNLPLSNSLSSISTQYTTASPDPLDPQVPPPTFTFPETCFCPECPYKKELIQIDQCYEELLSPTDPYSSEFTF
jgi:hypothetical protein